MHRARKGGRCWGSVLVAVVGIWVPVKDIGRFGWKVVWGLIAKNLEYQDLIFIKFTR